MGVSGRRLTLLEAAGSEAKRHGHATGPGAAHLAKVLAREAPGALDVMFGAGAEGRLDAALRDGRVGEIAIERLLESARSEAPLDLLGQLRPALEAVLGGASDRAASWSVGNRLLDTYDVLGVAGEGGMGVVYRVHHREWDVDMAVKRPRPGIFDSEAGKTAFEAEAELWMDLGLHPNVCACHYARRLDGMPCVFAEYADGGSVDGLDRTRALYGDERADARIPTIGMQAALGLAHAHAHGVVHQDVKPGNLLLDGDEVKVTDFGLARASPPGSASDPRVSVAGMTPAYRSPEQARGEAVTAATDVWSLGVSMLELYMGGLPGPEGAAAAHVLTGFRARAPQPGLPPLPQAVGDLLERCLRQDPAERPSMDELADRLAEHSGRERPRLAKAELLAGELSNRALSMLDLGRPQDAEALWSQALEVDARHAQATYNLGLHLWRAARITDDELVRRLEAIGDRYHLALAHIERGNPTAARSLVRARPSDPPEEIAAFNIAVTSGDTERCERVLEGPRGAFNDVAITANGHGAFGTDAIWDLETGERAELPLGAGDEPAWSVAFADEQGMLAVGGQAGSVRLCAVAAGIKVLRSLDVHTSTVDAIAITPDGRFGISGSRDRTAYAHDFVNGLMARMEGHTDAVSAVALSDNGRWAVTAGFDGTLLVWDAALGRVLRRIDAHHDWVNAVATTPDGRLALSGSQDTTARLWDTQSGRCLRTLDGAAHHVTAVTLSVDGTLALTGHDGGAVRVWELADGRCRRTLAGHNDRIAAIAMTPDASRAISCDLFGKARVWDLQRHPVRRSQFAYTRPRDARDAAEAHARLRAELDVVERLVAAGDAAGALRRLRELRLQPGYERHPLVREQWRRAGRGLRRARLTAAWQAHAVKAHQAGPAPRTGGGFQIEAGMRLIAHTGGVRNSIRAVAVTPNGTRAITAGHDNAARVWDPRTGRELVALPHPHWATAAALSADGTLAVTGCHDGALRTWDPLTGVLLGELPGHANALASIALSADGRIAITGGFDMTAQIWDLESGRRLRVLDGQRDPVALTPDGRLALTGAQDHVARIWSVDSGECVRELAMGEHFGGAAIASHGRIAVAGVGRELRVCDVSTGRAVHTLDNRGIVEDVAVAGDGRLALSGDMERRVRLWDLASGSELATLDGHTDVVGAVALTADADLALSGAEDGELRVWELDWEFEAPQAGAAGSPVPPSTLSR